MNTLVAFRDHGVHAQQARAFGGPVARRSRSVFLPGENHQRHAFGDVFRGRVEDRHLGAVGQVACESALGVHHLVAQADVGERAAHHHFMIAAARAVGVEVGWLDAVLDQILSGRAVFLDRARRRNVVGRHAVAEHGEHARVLDVLDGTGLQLHVVEVRSLADVGRVVLPSVGLALAAPAGIASASRRRRPRHSSCGTCRRRSARPPRRLRFASARCRPGKRAGRLCRGRADPSCRSISMRPASANATTSGGDIR